MLESWPNSEFTLWVYGFINGWDKSVTDRFGHFSGVDKEGNYFQQNADG